MRGNKEISSCKSHDSDRPTEETNVIEENWKIGKIHKTSIDDPASWSHETLKERLEDLKEHVKEQEQCLKHLKCMEDYNNGLGLQSATLDIQQKIDLDKDQKEEIFLKRKTKKRFNDYMEESYKKARESNHAKEGDYLQLSEDLIILQDKIKEQDSSNKPYRMQFFMDEKLNTETSKHLSSYKKELMRNELWLYDFEGISNDIVEAYCAEKQTLEQEKQKRCMLKKRKKWYEGKLRDEGPNRLGSDDEKHDTSDSFHSVALSRFPDIVTTKTNLTGRKIGPEHTRTHCSGTGNKDNKLNVRLKVQPVLEKSAFKGSHNNNALPPGQFLPSPPETRKNTLFRRFHRKSHRVSKDKV